MDTFEKFGGLEMIEIKELNTSKEPKITMVENEFVQQQALKTLAIFILVAPTFQVREWEFQMKMQNGLLK